ncbi:MAG: 6-pyruvoyl-tetrahydropterin synthase-related protein, partial [Candidatus Binatia bacterium]
MTDALQRHLASVVVPALVYLAAAAVLTWPLLRGLGTQVLTSGPFFHGDILLVIWATTWSAYALTSAPLQLFDPPTFHPSRGVLAGSEHFVGTLPLFAPVWAATANPVLAFNATVLASLVLAGLGVHLLVRRWTGDPVAAYVAGLAFLVAPWRRLVLGTAPHVNAVAYLPFVLLWLDTAMRRGRMRAALLAAIALALQIACSYYLGYVALALVLSYVAADLLGAGWHGRARLLGAAALALGGGLVLVAPVTLPYLAYVGAGRASVWPEEFQYQEAFRSWARVVG